MEGMATIIKENGRIDVVKFKEPVKLGFLQTAVGGSIETVPYFSSYNRMRCVAFCNEEGKLKKMEVNTEANKEWLMARARAGMEPDLDDILVGPIVIIQGDDEFMEKL